MRMDSSSRPSRLTPCGVGIPQRIDMTRWTCPALVDLAAMRDAVVRSSGSRVQMRNARVPYSL
jgi:hypothetical protein